MLFFRLCRGIAHVTILLVCWTGASHAERRSFAPEPGTPLRTEIMDAARRATRTDERFIVGELIVLQDGSESSAFAELAVKDREIGGVFMFRKVEGIWATIAMLGGGGGSRACSDVIPIVRDFENEVGKLGFTDKILPHAFLAYREEARKGGEDCHVARRFISSEKERSPADIDFEQVTTRCYDQWEGARGGTADCIRKAEKSFGAELAAAYADLRQKIGGSIRDDAKAAQFAWLEFQKKECKLQQELASFEGPGTPLPLGFGELGLAKCLLQTTLQRRDDLRRLSSD